MTPRRGPAWCATTPPSSERAMRAWLPERQVYGPERAGERDIDGLNRVFARSEEHTSELQSQSNLVCRLLLEKKKTKTEKLCCLLDCSVSASSASLTSALAACSSASSSTSSCWAGSTSRMHLASRPVSSQVAP